MTMKHTIRKVICPTDLSPSAQNATLYAAQFCQLHGAALELVYIKPVWQQLLLVTTGNAPVAPGSDVDEMNLTLKQLCFELHLKYNISCTYDMQHAILTVSDVLREKCGPGVMVIAGTNGADRFVQRVFGSITFRMSRDLDAPVLVIPEGVQFSVIRQVVFAWDYHPEQSCLTCLRDYAEELKSKLVFLHVSTHETEISKDVFRALVGALKEKLNSTTDVEIARIYASQIKRGLDEFISERDGSILAVSYRNGKLLRRFFRKEAHAQSLFKYPLLILHTAE